MGPEPTPEYRWVGPATSRRMRTNSVRLGLVMLLCAVIGGALAVRNGLVLPTAGHPFNTFGVILVLATVFVLFLCAVGALAVRRYVLPEHINVAAGRVVGRMLLGLSIFGLMCAVLAWGVLMLTARAVSGAGTASAVWGYLLIPGVCSVLSLVGGLWVRALFRRGEPAPPGQPQVTK